MPPATIIPPAHEERRKVHEIVGLENGSFPLSPNEQPRGGALPDVATGATGVENQRK